MKFGGNMKTMHMNENQTKKIMLLYQQTSKRINEIKNQVLALQKEYQILKEEREEEIAGRQLMRKMNLAASSPSAYVNTSRVEQALYHLNEQEKLIENKIKELIKEYKFKKQSVDLIEKLLDRMSIEESWILKKHYGKNYSMQQLAKGDGEKRIQLWRLERKARRSFAMTAADSQMQIAQLHNQEKR